VSPGPPIPPILVQIAPGELIDKITILQIKGQRIADPQQRQNVRGELEMLVRAHQASIGSSPELDALSAELQAVNAALWDIEDQLRDCERNQDFGGHFIQLARSVYRSNDRRAALKRQINDLLGSEFTEEKSYSRY
jgi:hypothetical protein